MRIARRLPILALKLVSSSFHKQALLVSHKAAVQWSANCPAAAARSPSQRLIVSDAFGIRPA
jgi:hypothetical protein